MGRDFEYDDEFLDSCSKETKNFGKNKGKIYTEEEINDLVAQKVLQELEKKEKEAREEVAKKELRKIQRQEKIEKANASIQKNRRKFTLKLAGFAAIATLILTGVLGFGHLMFGNSAKEKRNYNQAKAAFKSNPAYMQSVESDKAVLLERVKEKILTEKEYLNQLADLESQAYAEEYVKTNYPDVYESIYKQMDSAGGKEFCSLLFGLLGLVGSVVGALFFGFNAREDFIDDLEWLAHQIQDDKRYKKALKKEIKMEK